MIKENITKKYSVYSSTINWGDVLLQKAVQPFQLYNMYFTKFNNNTDRLIGLVVSMSDY